MSQEQTDLGARVSELEATVRGLTQELVDANERIRSLEAAVEDEPEPEAAEAATDGGTGGGTRQMTDDGEADDETASDLDGIIVA